MGLFSLLKKYDDRGFDKKEITKMGQDLMMMAMINLGIRQMDTIKKDMI